MVRSTAGRQRVEMKKIENEEALQVTFSKRRSGLFKKGSELAILCGAELLIIAFSPANRPYVFASPDFNTIKQRFLTGNPVRPSDPYLNRGILIRQLVHECMDVTSMKEMEKKRLNEFKQYLKDSGVLDEEDLSLEELEHYLVSMEELKRKLVNHLEHLKYIAINCATPMFDMGPEQTFVLGNVNPVHGNPNVQHTNMTASMGFTDGGIGGLYMGGAFGFQTGESSASAANLTVPRNLVDPTFNPSGSEKHQSGGSSGSRRRRD